MLVGVFVRSSVQKSSHARYVKKVKIEEGETSNMAETLSERIDRLSRVLEFIKSAQPDRVRRSVRSEYTAIQDFINGIVSQIVSFHLCDYVALLN